MYVALDGIRGDESRPSGSVGARLRSAPEPGGSVLPKDCGESVEPVAARSIRRGVVEASNRDTTYRAGCRCPVPSSRLGRVSSKAGGGWLSDVLQSVADERHIGFAHHPMPVTERRCHTGSLVTPTLERKSFLRILIYAPGTGSRRQAGAALANSGFPPANRICSS